MFPVPTSSDVVRLFIIRGAIVICNSHDRCGTGYKQMYMCSMYRVKVASFYWENDSKISYIYRDFHVHVLLKVYIILNVNDITVCLVICLFIYFF